MGGRNLKTTVQIVASQLVPDLHDKSSLMKHEERYRKKYKESYDKRHKVRKVPKLTPGSQGIESVMVLWKGN